MMELRGVLRARESERPVSSGEERSTRSLILAALLERPGRMPLELAHTLSLTGRRLRTFLTVWWILRDAGHITFTGDTVETSRWYVTAAGRDWYAANASPLARTLLRGATT